MNARKKKQSLNHEEIPVMYTPPEILAIIFSFLSIGERMNAALVTKQYYEVANSSFFWKQDCVRLGITIPQNKADVNFKRLLKESRIYAERHYYAIGNQIDCCEFRFLMSCPAGYALDPPRYKPKEAFSLKRIDACFPTSGSIVLLENAESAKKYAQFTSIKWTDAIGKESPVFVVSFDQDIIIKEKQTLELTPTNNECADSLNCAKESRDAVSFYRIDTAILPSYKKYSVRFRDYTWDYPEVSADKKIQDCLVM